MEIAGEICQVCAHPVLSEIEAVACQHCQTAFHRGCLESVEQVCANCGQVWNAAAEPATETESPLRFVEGELQRPKTPLLYRFSLVAVSLAMVLLVLAYLGLIAAFAWGVYEYASHFYSILEAATFGLTGIFFAFLFYVVPLFIGLFLIVFLIKPLFAAKSEEHEAFSLNHADAPHLFALIGWICRSLDAPIPSRIDVDYTVNAGAAFRSGWRSIFGNDIILVIGLPLAAGMNLNQFAGILVHEYGHFSQGSAMRASYLIRQINAWFYHAVHGRDTWDVALELASEEEHQGLLWLSVLHSARLGVALTRLVLWVLMVCGHALSCLMSRQMEFDADRYLFRMCGSANFAGSMRRLRQLNLGSNEAMRQLKEKWKKERRLFDQIPDFIVSRANEIPADAQEKLHASLAKRRTRVFDMHPSDAERIARALAAREPGIFHPTTPATSLFANFAELSRRVTLRYYQNALGPRFRAECLISTEQTQARAEHDYAADREIIRRYFFGIATDSRPVIIKENKSLVFRRRETLEAEIQSCRREMEELLPTAQMAFAEFRAAEARLLQAGQAAQLLEAGFQFDPTEFSLLDNDVERALVEARETMQAAAAQLQAFEAAGSLRLTDAVQLLRLPQVGAVVPQSAKLQEDAKELIWVLSRMEDFFEPLLELRRDCATLEVLLRYRRSQPSADNVTAALDNLCTGIQERVNAIQEQTALIRYPFHHATEQVLVSEYARNKEYHADPVELALAEGKSHTEKLLDLYCRLLGNLAVIGEEVEQSIGKPA